jgi:hypothetical protein
VREERVRERAWWEREARVPRRLGGRGSGETERLRSEETLVYVFILQAENQASLGLLGLGLFKGGPYSVPASENRFMEAVGLRQLPPLIRINGGSPVKATASINS